MYIFHPEALLAVFMPVMCTPQPGLTSSHDPFDEGQIVSTQARATLYCIKSKSKLQKNVNALFRLRYIYIADDVCPSLSQLTSNDLMAL